MTLPLYFLSGIPWALYAVSIQLRNPPASYPLARLVLCILLNVTLWPIAPIIAAIRKV